MDGIVALLLSKKFTKDTVIGMGAIKGAPCQVQSINKVDDTTTITLEWKDDLDVSHTQSFNVIDGADGLNGTDGVSVTNATINAVGNLILTLSNGNNINCGKVLPQYDTLPTPSISNVGTIYQYTGDTDSDYTNGYFYKCVLKDGSYIWENIKVQEGGDLPIASSSVLGGIKVGNDLNIDEEGTLTTNLGLEINNGKLCVRYLTDEP